MTKKTKKKESAYASLKGFHRAVPIILVAISVFIALCFVTHNTGKVGLAISDFLLGSFSVGGYFIPAVLVLHAFFYPSDIQKKRRLISRVIFSFVVIITVSAMTHAVANYGEDLVYSARELYENGKSSNGGGFVGGTVAFAIISMIDYLGLILLALTVFAIYVTYFFAGEKSVLRRGASNLIYKLVNSLAKAEKKLKDSKKEKAERRLEKERAAEKRLREKKDAKRAEALMAKEEELYNDEFFAVDNGLKELKIRELGINESRRDEDIEKNPTLQEKVHPRSQTETANRQYETFETATEPLTKKDNSVYGINEDGDIVVDNYPSGFESTNVDIPKNSFVSDSADSFFANGFDPYSLAENERLANKPSSRSGFERADGGVTEFKEPESTARTFTEEEIEAARRRAGFEMRREALTRLHEEEKKADTNPSYYESDREKHSFYTEDSRTGEEFNKNSSKAQFTCGADESVSYAEDITQSANEPYAETPSLSEENGKYKTPADNGFKIFSAAESKSEIHRTESADESDTLKITRAQVTESIADEDEENDETLCVFSEEKMSEDGKTGADYDSDADVFNFDDGDSENEDEDNFEEKEIAPENQNPDVLKYRSMYSIFNDNASESEFKPLQSTPTPDSTDDFSAPTVFKMADDTDDTDEEYGECEDADKSENGEDFDEDDIPFEYTPSPISQQRKTSMQEEKKPSDKPDYSNFKFPPIDLLAKGKDSDDPSIEVEIQENGEKLIDALAQFNVRASVRSVDRGPRITRYEIVPARGVRVNSVISLFDDIALNLAAEGIRMEAPIPGKSAIGVEIPNKNPTTVMLRDLLESEEFKNESSKTFACVGKDVTGNPVFGDISKMPHVLVAGATGMGKSVCINSILISILYKARPDEVKLIMVDPKTVEFTMYNGIPHLLVPVVTDVKQAAGALMWAIDEMNRRYELMSKHEVRKLDSYNDLVKADPSLGEPLPKIIIVIDELNDLMQQVRKPVEGLITNITQKARAAGIHMIIGTQRPSVDVITGVIKANVPSRISCKVTSFNDSKTILDQAGAEKLLDKGDMLYAPVGKPKPVRVQGAFVSDGEVEKIMKFLKSNVKGNVYDEQALEDMTRAAQKCSKGKDNSFDDDFDTDSGNDDGAGYLNDKQFLEAVDLAVKQGKISTSLIQRKLSIGYGKAAKFIDIMEELGIVSEPNGQKPRDVLVSRDEWREMLSRRSLDD